MDDFLAGEGGLGEKNAKQLLSKDIYSNLEHSCGYYNIDKFNNMTQNFTNTFSIFSLNIRSLPKKLDITFTVTKKIFASLLGFATFPPHFTTTCTSHSNPSQLTQLCPRSAL